MKDPDVFQIDVGISEKGGHLGYLPLLIGKLAIKFMHSCVFVCSDGQRVPIVLCRRKESMNPCGVSDGDLAFDLLQFRFKFNNEMHDLLPVLQTNGFPHGGGRRCDTRDITKAAGGDPFSDLLAAQFPTVFI